MGWLFSFFQFHQELGEEEDDLFKKLRYQLMTILFVEKPWLPWVFLL